MSKIFRKLIDCLRKTFSLEFIDKIARKTKFIQRTSPLNAEKFISLCVFYENSICETSLTKLTSMLAAEENILISPQALDERFNEYSVEFLKEILKELMINQNKVLRDKSKKLQHMFSRINVVDSTIFKLPDNFIDVYPGTGRNTTNAAVKIQLQYDILSGEFLASDVCKGTKNDSEYIPEIQKFIQPNDLYLKDLGYFKMSDMNIIKESEAFFISKIKKECIVYIYDGKKYSQVNLLEMVKALKEGETLDIPQAAIGAKGELKIRLVVTKLSEENKRKRAERDKEQHKRCKSRMDDERLDLWNSVNIYITNIDGNMLEFKYIYDLYSLRWQIEIMFKIWKSIFKIDKVKKVKLHRFECFLYGRLISILLNSLIVFKVKKTVNVDTEYGTIEISDLKAFAIAKENSCNIKNAILRESVSCSNVLSKIIDLILKYGVKSKSKRKKTSGNILKSIQLAVLSLEL